MKNKENESKTTSYQKNIINIFINNKTNSKDNKAKKDSIKNKIFAITNFNSVIKNKTDKNKEKKNFNKKN